jgi:hypothetical protein
VEYIINDIAQRSIVIDSVSMPADTHCPIIKVIDKYTQQMKTGERYIIKICLPEL